MNFFVDLLFYSIGALSTFKNCGLKKILLNQFVEAIVTLINWFVNLLEKKEACRL